MDKNFNVRLEELKELIPQLISEENSKYLNIMDEDN